ncbi:N-lysine methyltransferase setd6 [Aquarana catesbeiana]|uniref:N-lysine methyltransferase SETD6 n=1 Tax=Aquarana catesbeiana TaxID=8400 RepID=A0A2G9RV72_AQUCT|nr:N-lysine methyltransferase setd6 [Aquarana catesbeiana]
MSPEGKRRKLQEENQDPVSAHNDPVSTHHDPVPAPEDLLSSFQAWCGEFGIHLNPKVSIGMEGTVAQYGMMARQDIPAGEVVFTIPRSALLSQNTTRIREVLEEEQQSLDSASGWVPLILSLMYEATDAGSPWAPYFGLWPRLVPPDLPMFWSEKERSELLEGTGVPDAVSKDLDNIEQEYKTIVLPFILRHPELFNPQTHTLDLYMRLVAFVMAYSFQEPIEDEEEDCGKEVLPPMMVPVADLLNHVARHNTHLEFAADCLRMVTTQSVPAGHELFNTYGQMGNWQLLHMYGFSEPHPDNINDTADIQMTVLREAALQGAESEEQKAKLQERWAFLCHMEMVGEEGAFVFGCEEVLTDEELRTSLKLLCMSAEEFAEYKENDGWEEDEDDDEEEETLTYQKVACMPLSWRKLLHAGAELAMKSYTTNLRSDQCILDDPAEYAKLSSRQKYSLQVRYGQKRILQRLIELTAS